MSSLRACQLTVNHIRQRAVMTRWTPICVRVLSTRPPERKPGFFSKLIDNIKQDMEKSKEMKDSLKQFREETEKLEQSDALKKVRDKYKVMEDETTRQSQVLKEQLGAVKGKLQEALDEAKKSEIAKKAGESLHQAAEGISKTAHDISKTTQQLGKSGAFKGVSEGVKAVKEEIDQATMFKHKIYKTPRKLRKRSEWEGGQPMREVSANTDATGVELHKDSKWFQSWETFKNSNQYYTKVLDWKVKYDESDNPVVRASRMLTDKVSDIMGGLFQKNELSETLTEICKMDPSFDKDRFLRDCEVDIIPNVLEAMIRGDLEILQDWCYEAPFNVLATPIRQAHQLNYHFDSTVLDIDHVDLAMGKMMEQGPVLVISFVSQQILCVRDSKDNVVEGSPDQILRVNYVWVLCRDQTELNPRAAWRLLEMSAHSSQQVL